MNKFIIRNKGFGKCNLFVPGWATGAEIFEQTMPHHDHIYVNDFDPFTFTMDLADFISETGIKSMSMTGFSMGAAALLHSLKDLGHCVENVVLVGMKKKYKKDDIEAVKLNLIKNKEAFLYRFYSDMFSPSEKTALSTFKTVLMKKYMDRFSTEYLLSGLDYLESIESDFLEEQGRKVKFLYGSVDKIVTVLEVEKYKKEAENIAGTNPMLSFCFIEGAGHAPFTNEPGIL